MDWTQVDLGRRHVQFLNTKNGQSRSCPLHPVGLAALANLPHRAGPFLGALTGCRMLEKPTVVVNSKLALGALVGGLDFRV
jgi:hypothetical protein